MIQQGLVSSAAIVYPKVNTYASAPRSRKVISSVRSRTDSRWRTSWYRRPSSRTPPPSSSTSMPFELPGASPSSRTRNGIGSLALRERTRCASRAWKRKAMLPFARSSVTFSAPDVHSPASPHCVPIGLRLNADRVGGDEIALNPKEPLNEPL